MFQEEAFVMLNHAYVPTHCSSGPPLMLAIPFSCAARHSKPRRSQPKGSQYTAAANRGCPIQKHEA